MKIRIYKLFCNPEIFYVGSTIRDLRSRFSEHKYKSKTQQTQLYNYINEIGWEWFDMELLEEKEVKTYEDGIKLEKEWVKRLDPVLNGKAVQLSKDEEKQWNLSYEQRRKTDPKRIAWKTEYNKKYKEDNRDKLREYQKLYMRKKRSATKKE